MSKSCMCMLRIYSLLKKNDHKFMYGYDEYRLHQSEETNENDFF